jgi:hypothetical protein
MMKGCKPSAALAEAAVKLSDKVLNTRGMWTSRLSMSYTVQDLSKSSYSSSTDSALLSSTCLLIEVVLNKTGRTSSFSKPSPSPLNTSSLGGLPVYYHSKADPHQMHSSNVNLADKLIDPRTSLVQPHHCWLTIEQQKS